MSQNQPSLRAAQEQQPPTRQRALTRKQKAEIKHVKNLNEKIRRRQIKWFEGGQILTKQSPEIQKFRAELKALSIVNETKR